MYKVDLVTPNLIILSDNMVGGDEVQVQEVSEGNAQDETQTLTNEDIKEIKEKVEEKEEIDLVTLLLKNIIDTVMMEELFEINRKMNLFRKVLAEGVLKFAEGHMDDTPKLDRFSDSFRAAWRVYKEDGDKEKTMDAFMKAMDNELWTPSNSEEDTDVFGV